MKAATTIFDACFEHLPNSGKGMSTGEREKKCSLSWSDWHTNCLALSDIASIIIQACVFALTSADTNTEDIS